MQLPENKLMSASRSIASSILTMDGYSKMFGTTVAHNISYVLNFVANTNVIFNVKSKVT